MRRCLYALLFLCSNAFAAPIALFIGDIAWMTDQTIYAPLVSRLQAKGYDIRTFGLPWSGDLTIWAQQAQTNPRWISDYVSVFGTSINGGLPTLGVGPIVIIGTSRGAFCAFQLAAAYPQFQYVVGISPAIDLGLMTEFQGMNVKPNLYGLALALEPRSIFMEIGSQDYRVGSVPPSYLSYYIGETASAEPDVTVMIRASSGHTPPPQVFDDVINWLVERGK